MMGVVMEPVESLPPGRSIYPWEQMRQTLISHPGQWYCMMRDIPVATASNLKEGKIKGFNSTEFEFQLRDVRLSNGVRRADLYGKRREQ